MDETENLPSLPGRSTLLWIVAGFFLVTLALYGSGLMNPFVRWDDGLLVYENPAVRQISPANIAYIFTHYDPELYIPLTFLSYQFDYLIGQGSTLPFHLGNLLLHTFNALLAGWLAFLLSRKGWIGIGLGLIFAVHPLNTEAVMWVSARKDVLSAFFFFVSVVGYLYARDRQGREGEASTLLYWGSVAAFALGLLAKVMIIPLPVVLVLLDLHQRRKINRAMIVDKLPYVAIAVVLGLVAVFGKTGVIESTPLTSKILMAFLSAVFYIKQILFPLHLSLLYPYTQTVTITSPDFYVPILIIIAITGGAVMLWKRTRDPLLWFGFFLVLVAPSFVNFSKGEMDMYFASDRYTYLGAFGILYLVFLGLSWASERWEMGKNGLFGVLAVLVALGGYKAHAQSAVWANTQTLFQNVIVEYPDASYVAYNNLGSAMRLTGDLEGALESYQKSLAIRQHPKVLSNIGATLRKLKRPADARIAFEKALEMNAQSKEAHFGMGLILSDEGKFADAIAQYDQAVTIDPMYEEAFTNMGVAQFNAGKVQEAIEAYGKSLAINPYFPDARYNLAVALTQAGKLPEAIAEYENVTNLAPQFIPARLNLGLLYAKTGKLVESRRQFEIVLKLSPTNAAAQQMLKQLEDAGA